MIYTADGSEAAGKTESSGTDYTLSVYFFNVGRADSALISVGGANYLVDTGEKDTADRLCEMLGTLGVERLDAVILTHTHSDHTGGLKTVSGALEIGRLFSRAYRYRTRTAR